MMKTCRVAATLWTLIVSVAAAGEAPPDACKLRGEVIQWVADYCMLKMQTDDEIAVSDCIAENHDKAFPNACAAKVHYKEAMCRLVAATGNSAPDLDRCLLDPGFMGRTVKQNGVGG